jgi:hypothetical protein
MQPAIEKSVKNVSSISHSPTTIHNNASTYPASASTGIQYEKAKKTRTEQTDGYGMSTPTTPSPRIDTNNRAIAVCMDSPVKRNDWPQAQHL